MLRLSLESGHKASISMKTMGKAFCPEKIQSLKFRTYFSCWFAQSKLLPPGKEVWRLRKKLGQGKCIIELYKHTRWLVKAKEKSVREKGSIEVQNQIAGV